MSVEIEFKTSLKVIIFGLIWSAGNVFYIEYLLIPPYTAIGNYTLIIVCSVLQFCFMWYFIYHLSKYFKSLKLN